MDVSQKLYDTIVVGAGISGLTAGYTLQKKGESVLLLEKSEHIGGAIRSEHKQGFLLERGPRALRPVPETMALVNELGLDDQIIWSKEKRRFIYSKGRLIPVGPKFLLKAAWPFCKELFMRPTSRPEETIASFSNRHFGSWFTAHLMDPLTLGIYGGDIHRLSLDRCFPLFKTLEQTKGSVIRGLLSKERSKLPPLFSLKGGMQTLTDALASRLPILINTPLLTATHTDLWHLTTPSATFRAKNLISTIAGPEERLSLAVVTLCYEEDLLKQKGFGFLVPTHENLSLLGIIFDSCLFNESCTRLSMMMRPTNEADALEKAQLFAREILGITAVPSLIDYFYAENAIPQYTLGQGHMPPVGVNACIKQGLTYQNTHF